MSVKRKLIVDADENEREASAKNTYKKFQTSFHPCTTLRDKQEFILVWFDIQSAALELIDVLKSLNNDVHHFHHSSQCLQYIQSVNAKDHIFLIISSFSPFIDDVHKLRQIDTIFLYRPGNLPDEFSSESLTTKYNKLMIVSNGQEQLIDCIVTMSRELAKQHHLFNLYNHKQKAFCNLSQSSTSFLWFQLFKKMLIDVPQTDFDQEKNEIAKQHMIKHCYEYYRHNKTQLKNIAEFEATYKASNAIRWYTSDTFVYKLVNKALRTEDMEVLHTFRFFLIDLCNNLNEKYNEMVRLKLSLPSVVYRGGQMNKAEIEMLEANKGCFIATNGFLSTSRMREVAQFYAGSGMMKSKRRDEIHAVIFELILPSDLYSIVFADVANLSQMSDEKEVLFDLGTTFVITDVFYDPMEQIWNVRLTGSDKGRDIVTKEYIDYYREHTESLSSTVKLGEFLIVIGQYEKAREYFQSLMTVDNDNDDQGHILYNLAWIDRCQSNFTDARVKIDQAYELEIQRDRPSQTVLRNLLIDSGSLHLINDEPHFAMNCFLQANQMTPTSAVFNSIGLTYRHRGQWNEALKFFDKALTTDTQNWPNGHYGIGIVLDNIGRTYNDLGQYKKALTFHLRGLKMKERTIPDDHLDIGISLNNVGFTYDNLEMYDKALIYYERALNIYRMCLPEIHIELSILLDNMAIAHRWKDQFKECFQYHYQALHIKERLKPVNLRLLAQTLHNLGVAYAENNVHNDQQDDKKALEYFQRSISTHQLNQSLQSSDLARTFYEKGRLHQRREEYQTALDLFIQALHIQEKTLRRNHPATLSTRDALISLKIQL